MNKQRLLELAGIGSNMSNPSFEPATDVQDNKLELPANLDTGGDGENFDDFDKQDEMMRRTLENVLPQVKELAMQGMSFEDIEQARGAFENILELLGEELE